VLSHPLACAVIEEGQLGLVVIGTLSSPYHTQLSGYAASISCCKPHTAAIVTPLQYFQRPFYVQQQASLVECECKLRLTVSVGHSGSAWVLNMIYVGRCSRHTHSQHRLSVSSTGELAPCVWHVCVCCCCRL